MCDVTLYLYLFISSAKEDDADETINTLEYAHTLLDHCRYAQRTRKITNRPIKNITQVIISPRRSISSFVVPTTDISDDDMEFQQIYTLMTEIQPNIRFTFYTLDNQRCKPAHTSSKGGTRRRKVENTTPRTCTLHHILYYIKLTQHPSKQIHLSTFTQTDNVVESDHTERPMTRTNSMDLLEMHNLTPKMVIQHMFSSTTLIESEPPQNGTPSSQRYKVELAKQSTRLHKEYALLVCCFIVGWKSRGTFMLRKS